MKAESTKSAPGFSLVELTIAMLVTLIISGAIFGLLSGGKTAFRREPELSDRQQNIRVAMDLIQKDIGTAGMAMSDFVQAFTRGDGPLGTPAPPLNGLGPMGPDGVESDFLQIFGNTGVSGGQGERTYRLMVRMMECSPTATDAVVCAWASRAPIGTTRGSRCPRGGGADAARACANFPRPPDQLK